MCFCTVNGLLLILLLVLLPQCCCCYCSCYSYEFFFIKSDFFFKIYRLYCFDTVSVRKSIWPLKNWVLRCWDACLEWVAYGWADAIAAVLSLVSCFIKIQNHVPFWCSPLNGHHYHNLFKIYCRLDLVLQNRIFFADSWSKGFTAGCSFLCMCVFLLIFLYICV